MFCNPAGLQLIYDTSQTTAYINYNYSYIYFSHHIAGLCMKTKLFSHYRKQFFMRKRLERETPHKGLLSVSVGIIRLIPLPDCPL